MAGRNERQITGRIATCHFSPTPLSKQNLLNEGIEEKQILVTGNTVIDALYAVVRKIKDDPALETTLNNSLKSSGYDVDRLNNARRLVLAGKTSEKDLSICVPESKH